MLEKDRLLEGIVEGRGAIGNMRDYWLRTRGE